MHAAIELEAHVSDADEVAAGAIVAELSGSARDMLTCERPLLNLLGRLSGVATLTRAYVRQIEGTAARIYDTRKTTPGWRRLEKYAVRCGGGYNHRTGLFDAVLIKDNHLALAAERGLSPADAVGTARDFIAQRGPENRANDLLLEIEVDRLEQLDDVLRAEPDIVLLDNMSPDELRSAVARRNEIAPQIELEASGGVSLATVRDIALAGVERISVGGLTHAARWLDLGLDWDSHTGR
jgi:nicotinate-nucleotide pyrophosphorylase (carboxylating)